jgi:hypothetical protein
LIPIRIEDGYAGAARCKNVSDGAANAIGAAGDDNTFVIEPKGRVIVFRFQSGLSPRKRRAASLLQPPGRAGDRRSRKR